MLTTCYWPAADWGRGARSFPPGPTLAPLPEAAIGCANFLVRDLWMIEPPRLGRALLGSRIWRQGCFAAGRCGYWNCWAPTGWLIFDLTFGNRSSDACWLTVWSRPFRIMVAAIALAVSPELVKMLVFCVAPSLESISGAFFVADVCSWC